MTTARDEFDAAVVAEIARGPRRFADIRIALQLPEEKTRTLDRSLQRLRESGRIQFGGKVTAQWQLANRVSRAEVHQRQGGRVVK